MKRAVRSLIQIIAAGVILFGALEIGLEIAHHQMQVREHVTPIRTNVWRYLTGAVLLVIGAVLFLGSDSLAEQLTDDIEEDD
jgi:drug/metabolite transporter (DMT)-like permease